jgi:hypothetical protein
MMVHSRMGFIHALLIPVSVIILCRHSQSISMTVQCGALRLDRERLPWSRALAYPIKAGIAALRRDTAGAATLFALAVTRLEDVDVHLHAAASRRRLGTILGGDDGRGHVERADAWMRQQSIQDPARMADIFAPAVE